MPSPSYRLVVECLNPECNSRIALPNQILQEKSQSRGDRPTDETPLWILCPACGTLFVRSVEDFQDESADQSEQPQSFWRLAQQCAEPNCGLTISVYTASSASASQQVVRRFLQAHLGEVNRSYCANGHPGPHVERGLAKIE